YQLSTCLLLAAGMCLAMCEAGAGEKSSLSDRDIEVAEAKMTLQGAAEENVHLREQLKIVQTQVKSLSESLAIANAEAEVLRREAVALKLRMEAIGLDGASTDKGKLEQRLLKAVGDLKIVQDEKNKLSDQLALLTEA